MANWDPDDDPYANGDEPPVADDEDIYGPRVPEERHTNW